MVVDKVLTCSFEQLKFINFFKYISRHSPANIKINIKKLPYKNLNLTI